MFFLQKNWFYVSVQKLLEHGKKVSFWKLAEFVQVQGT
jgi:hypothetical protein